MHANQHPILPNPQTSFIGRERALAEVCCLLYDNRLLTLTGCGGSGKTRLALRIAECAARNVECRTEQLCTLYFEDGVFWVDLAALTEPELVPQAVARVLNLRLQGDQSLTNVLCEHLRQSDALLVLDNCEHLRQGCAELLAALFAAPCATHVLTTSREPLGIAGEQVWVAPMLALPDPRLSIAELQQVEAVQLFVERARTVAPAFTLHERNVEAVMEICRRLEGLPLALELAAARVNLLTPRQIVDRLDDTLRLLTRGVHTSQSRHATLRTALDWSFDLLIPAEQVLFTRLAVFAGNFTLEATEAVCAGDGLAERDLLDLLTGLVEQSLVMTTEQGDEMRYRLLEPIRQYAAERLRYTGEEPQWRQRHAAWCLALAERAEPALTGPHQQLWFDRLERELDHLRAALAWCAAAPERIENGLRLGSALVRFWITRGYASEGQRWLDACLPHEEHSVAPQVQVKALAARGRIASCQNHFLAARAYYERSLALARQIEYDEGVESALVGLGQTLWELGDLQAARSQLEEIVRYARPAQHLPTLGRALNTLGLVCMHQSDNGVARAYLDESLAVYLQLEDRAGSAIVLWNLALLAGQGGDFARARLLYHEALLIQRDLGNDATVADLLINLGALAVRQGEFKPAATYFEEAEWLYRQVGALECTDYINAGLGDIAFYAGEYEQARQYYQAALALFRSAGNQRLIARMLGRLGRLAGREGDLVAAATFSAEALELRSKIGHKAGLIFALEEEYGELAMAAGQPAVAARLLAAAEAARQAINRPRDPVENEPLQRLIARLQEQLGDAAWMAAWTEGLALTLEAASAYALERLAPTRVVQTRPELRVLAFGPLRIYRGERLLPAEEWVYAKARELVLYLLSRPNATREQIGLAFWPDASKEQVRKRFSAALAHARNALGREVEWITLTDGRYSIQRDAWFDVEQFEVHLGEARRLLQNGAPVERAVALLEEAVNLYQGDFAEDLLDGEWFVARRQALRQSYLDALLTLGCIQMQAGQTEQAIAAFQRALATDTYLEEAHLGLIRCYAGRNQRGHALRQYELLTQVLAELEATPSPETQALIERLRRNEPL